MKITSLFSDKPYSALAIAVCFAVMLILPWLHLLPVDSAFHLSAYWVTLIGKIMCLALVALALDLVWGYWVQTDLSAYQQYVVPQFQSGCHAKP